MNLMQLLQPTPEEIEKLALRETDPLHYAEFEPLTRGPLFAALTIIGVGIAAIAITPLRLMSRLIGRFR